MLAWTLTEKSVSLMLDGTPYSFSLTDPRASAIVDAIKADDENALRDLVDAKIAISKFTEGRVGFDGKELTFGGEPIRNAIRDRLVHFWENDIPFAPLMRFLDRLMDNHSYRAVEGLYRFLEACDLPITKEGKFLAYKIVTHDYKDLHTGTFDNSVGGPPVKMKRNQVDEDPNRTCSKGLHVCSKRYLPQYGGFYGAKRKSRVVVCEVDPADVVAVPSDYNDAKMRVCEYSVIAEISNDVAFGTVAPYYHEDPSDDEEEDFDEHDDDEEEEDFDDDFDGEVDDDFDDIVSTTAKTQLPPTRELSPSETAQAIKRELREVAANRSDMSLAAIGRKYNRDEGTVRKIRDGAIWKHINP